MSLPWPAAAARRLVAGEGRGLEPEAERGAGEGGVAQVDRATAPLRVRRVRWWMADDDAAVQWLIWARHYAGRIGAGGVTARARVRGGLGGVVCSSEVVAGRREWIGAAELEGPA